MWKQTSEFDKASAKQNSQQATNYVGHEFVHSNFRHLIIGIHNSLVVATAAQR